MKIIDDIRITIYEDGGAKKLEVISDIPREPGHVAEVLRQAVRYIVTGRNIISTAVQEGVLDDR